MVVNGLNPLDWNGGAFLALYAVLYIGAVIGGNAIASWLRPEGIRMPPGNDDELAVLAGGGSRLAETVLARLLSRDGASIDNGRITFGAPSVTSSTIEREVTQLSSPAKWSTIQQRAAAAARRIEEQLVSRALLMERGAARTLGLYAAIPLMLLIALGLAKLQVGIARDRPVGFLIAFLIASVVALLFRVFGTDRRTKAGIAVLKDVQQRSERLKRAPTSDETGTAVALFGTAVLVGSPLAELHRMRQGSGDSGSGWTDSSSSGDGSSSDGGSGCGGGGCGGCGS
jgi:uncharacterized protein (TIGR04222 family)